MPVGNRFVESKSHLAGCRLRAILFGLASPLLLALLFGGTGCMTRSDTPFWGPDSTLIYPSKIANDVNAAITFQLKDSALRDAEKDRDRARRREISRLRKERDKLLALEEERDQKSKAEAKRKAASEKKKAKGKKSKKSKSSSKEGRAGTERTQPASDPLTSVLPGPALRDSIQAIDAKLETLMTEDSLAAQMPWKIKRADGRPADERVFDIEEGARVLATIRLENIRARGDRPLTFHFVWLNPERKRVFKRKLEYVPNDSTQTLTSSLTMSPTKRSAGHYTLQVFLFREQIAEKSLELQGKGVEENQKGSGDAM